ncbi:MAG: hypothetical protein OXG25_01655 [Gammaproteobacteria bacterium]|nr:hypothetical protein [Gammaproteobacteria bacterium]
MRIITVLVLLLICSCSLPRYQLLNPIQTYEREISAIYDDVWVHALDAIPEGHVTRTSDYDEGLIVTVPKSNSASISGLADCGAQPFNTKLERHVKVSISISELEDERTRVRVKADYRINTQSQIDQRIRVFVCRSTGFLEGNLLDYIESKASHS